MDREHAHKNASPVVLYLGSTEDDQSPKPYDTERLPSEPRILNHLTRAD
ncbi:hypothetical protein AYL99_09761 [Fonsecaea erecta]|uniref:Uncharacterized protein n=1 Tax=Fonsecaea erecta TaxID=1367422 RepID=A0A178Z758_9EURO|nr:hypothetical protein AYL99_09761 [Fonsecaea erecta]OAP55610.1 hypothetical protein AYL99_09761 [Fonsecaea erecta]